MSMVQWRNHLKLVIHFPPQLKQLQENVRQTREEAAVVIQEAHERDESAYIFMCTYVVWLHVLVCTSLIPSLSPLSLRTCCYKGETDGIAAC